MELLFIWIEEYGILSEVGLNLSNKYRFSYDKDKKEIMIRETNDFIENFFSDSINNITGLVGANGTGKTSILRYIIEYCTDGINNSGHKKSIIFYKDKNQICYYTPYQINIKTELQANFLQVRDLDDFKDATNTIYLSNSFDPTSFYSVDNTRTSFGQTKNISTWYLLHSDYQAKYGKDANKNSVSFDQKMEAFATNEFVRIVKLLKWINRINKKISFPVPVPGYINIKLLFSRDTSRQNQFSEISRGLEKLFKINEDRKALFLIKATEAALFHLIDEDVFVVGPDIAKKQYQQLQERIIQYIKKENERNTAVQTDHLSQISSFLKAISDRFTINERFNDRLDQILRFITILDKLLKNKQVKLNENKTIIGIPINGTNIQTLESLIDEYYQVEKIGEYADFYLSHNYFLNTSMSSGEYCFLSLFARISNLKIERRRSILLLVDEAELALHPQWQKLFILLFTEFISERFKGKQVQIILTSHSPFILSDLPPHCVILLRKGEAKTELSDSLARKKETFGANVHELFTDSFFLQDGLIGEFARQKIDTLIKRVNNKTHFTRQDYQLLKREVDIIGEPFIRYKLLEKILGNMPEDQYDQVVLEREKELNLIKSIRNDKNRS